MASTLLIVQFVLGILITIAVMLQKSSSVGLGAYSGSNESVFGAKGANSFLVKVTVVLTTLFVINTVSLSFLYSSSKDDSIVDISPSVPTSPMKPAKTAPEAPMAPVTK